MPLSTEGHGVGTEGKNQGLGKVESGPKPEVKEGGRKLESKDESIGLQRSKLRTAHKSVPLRS